MKNKWWIKWLMMSFLVFPAGSSYRLEGFSFGAGGANRMSSSGFQIQGRSGEINSSLLSGGSFDLGAGLSFLRQASVPNKPTFVNNGNDYNKLHLTLDNTYLAMGSTEFPTIGVTDNFNRPNSVNLGPSWLNFNIDSTSTIGIASSTAYLSAGSGFAAGFYLPSTYGPDMEAMISIPTKPGNDYYISLYVRLSSTDPYVADGYFVQMIPKGDTDQVIVNRSDNGVPSQIGSMLLQEFSSGDGLGIRMRESTIEIFRQNSGIWSRIGTTWTDTTYSSAGYVGFSITGTVARVDDFGGGTYVSGSSAVEFPSDTKFAIAISKDNFVSTQYVKSDQTVGTSLTATDYQLYSQWGGGSGFDVIGLDTGTTYTVKVKAMQGAFTETQWGPTASAATVDPNLTFDIDIGATDGETNAPYQISLGDLMPASVVDSTERVWVDLTTNAVTGGNIYVYGQNAGLFSVTANYNIGSTTADLSDIGEGYGVQGVGATQTGGGPLTINNPYDGVGNVIGKVDTLVRNIFTSGSFLTAGRASFKIKAKSSNSTPAAGDYSEVLTVVASANY